MREDHSELIGLALLYAAQLCELQLQGEVRDRDLRKLTEQGKFREDLFYRINVICLRVPPLRERPEDILCLARGFLERCSGPARASCRLSPQAESALLRHTWPGNVRELEHAVGRACIFVRGPLIQPWDLFQDDASQESPSQPGLNPTLGEYLRDCEREFIIRALDQYQGHVSETAEGLGISRKNLWEKMRKLGIKGA